MPTRKQRGRRTQAVVADAFRRRGWIHAESTPASTPGVDVAGIPGVDVEVKGRRGFDPLGALKQAEKRSPGLLHLAVLRMDGQGEDADAYPVVLRLGALLDLLAGHPDHDPGLLWNSLPAWGCEHDPDDPANVLLTGGCRTCHMDRLRRDSLR